MVTSEANKHITKVEKNVNMFFLWFKIINRKRDFFPQKNIVCLDNAWFGKYFL